MSVRATRHQQYMPNGHDIQAKIDRCIAKTANDESMHVGVTSYHIL